jgi:hypothetical protein
VNDDRMIMNSLQASSLCALASRHMVRSQDVARAYATIYMQDLVQGREPSAITLELWRQSTQLANEWRLTSREANDAYRAAADSRDRVSR